MQAVVVAACQVHHSFGGFETCAVVADYGVKIHGEILAVACHNSIAVGAEYRFIFGMHGNQCGHRREQLFQVFLLGEKHSSGRRAQE